jgi:arylformamidase
MDAPRHFIRDGQSLDEMPLDATLGIARVIAIRDTVAITVEELREHNIQRGERILFKTNDSGQRWQSNTFVEDFVYISQEAARYLAEVGVKTVGVDYLSVGGYVKDSLETHLALLEAGIWVIEGLNLGQVEPGQYELYCLPLKVRNGDGAPARAVLRAI